MISINKIDEYFEIEGTYSITNFDMSNGKIEFENTGFLTVASTTSTDVNYTISNGTDGMTWESSYANLYHEKDDIFVFEDDNLFTFR